MLQNRILDENCDKNNYEVKNKCGNWMEILYK